MFIPIHSYSVEQPINWLWEQLRLYENEYIAKPFLYQRYKQQKISDVDQYAFRNVQSFCYYLRQGRACLSTTSPLAEWIEPITLYYGMMNMCKALILTIDPHYPKQTSLLKHGCTTRKKKRQPFRFLHDEIRVQKEGLLPHLFTHLFAYPIEGERFTPKTLMGMIPELQTAYRLITSKKTLIPIDVDVNEHVITVDLPESILDHYHLTPASWLHHFLRPVMANSNTTQITQKNGSLRLHWGWPNAHQSDWRCNHPWIFDDHQGNHYLWFDKEQVSSSSLPLAGSVYMLLFSLSMLARYDPPLWGELLTDSAEAAIIQPFLSWVKRWLPQFIYENLSQQAVQFNRTTPIRHLHH